MGSRAPHRHDVIDREFPVRITIAADPTTNERTRQWLQKHIGGHDYATAPQSLWSDQRAVLVYFRTLHAALMFMAGCPHIRLVGEKYQKYR